MGTAEYCLTGVKFLTGFCSRPPNFTHCCSHTSWYLLHCHAHYSCFWLQVLDSRRHMWDFLPLFWKKDDKKCHSNGIPWSSSHSIFLLSQGNTNFTWYADGGFRNLQKRMEQEKHEVSSQILTRWWGFKTFRQLRTIAAKVLQTLSNLLCIIWLIHLNYVYSKTVRRKGASSYRVLGKWSLSPSGRVTFSTSENGCVERYSAEVRLVFVGNFRWHSRVCLPNDRKEWLFTII